MNKGTRSNELALCGKAGYDSPTRRSEPTLINLNQVKKKGYRTNPVAIKLEYAVNLTGFNVHINPPEGRG